MSDIKLNAHAFTDKGLVRQDNEDSILSRSDLGLFAVADGMGGHSAGGEASAIALSTLQEKWTHVPHSSEEWFDLFRSINSAIRSRARENPEFHNMGTTLVAAAIVDHELVVSHTGDSRAYLLESGKLKRLTSDHTLVNALIRDGVIRKNEPEATFGIQHILEHALGPGEDVHVDTYRQPLPPTGTLFLCTDGVCGVLSDEALNAVSWSGDRALSEISSDIAELVYDVGAPDNLSIVLVRW